MNSELVHLSKRITGEPNNVCHIERKMRPYCGLELSNGGSKQSFNMLTKTKPFIPGFKPFNIKLISRFKHNASVDTRERMEKLAVN